MDRPLKRTLGETFDARPACVANKPAKSPRLEDSAPAPPAPCENSQTQLDILVTLIDSWQRTAAVAAVALAATPTSAPLSLELATLHSQSLAQLGLLGAAVAELEGGLQRMCSSSADEQPGLAAHPDAADDGRQRAELVNRCLLSSLYDLQLSAPVPLGVAAGGLHCGPASNTAVASSTCGGPCSSHGGGAGALLNYQCAMALASRLHDFPTLTRCAVALAELHIAGRDLGAASDTFDACVAACCEVADAGMRVALLQRVLPMSMEVLCMQGRIAESFERWRAYNQVLSLLGRSVPEECPICAEPFTPDRPCVALGCGHSFHRSCCDAWLGHRMFVSGTFRAECPVCKQVDPCLKPTPAAMQALEEFKRLRSGDGGASSSRSGSVSGSAGGSVSGGDSNTCGRSSATSGTTSGTTSGSGSGSDGDSDADSSMAGGGSGGGCSDGSSGWDESGIESAGNASGASEAGRLGAATLWAVAGRPAPARLLRR
ncbi:hypothetical protein HYH03_015003 [Edaphochlamys debaryana]|uniref:RING-type domain-containing protein n=1 Tax=Edaphochlamys debaryana TaxID=47281 RepID=A0A836BSZ8_9CHLO|nr:hypothetical protein HYH03_015003 [Edaphochlamys debaryana]|eukprot:KAG2486298.1 hypothetical protein HYH03_015003 [Edaphochlamys debaryana]